MSQADAGAARSPGADAPETPISTRLRTAAIASPKRFTISFLMATVLVVAGDFAVFEFLAEFEHLRDAAIIMLPMASLLVLTMPRVRGGPFWVGIQVTGWIATCEFGYLAWAEVQWFFWPLDWLGQLLPTFEQEANQLGELPATVIFYMCITLVYTPPLILLALLGGRIAASWVCRRVGRTAYQSAN